MRVSLAFIIILLLTGSPAMGDWADDFHINFREKGIDQAVVAALAEGQSPDIIIKTALPLENLVRTELVKALFCGLALPGSIYDAAEINGISDSTVSKGYELALGECAKEMEENLNAAVSPTIPSPDQSPSKRVRGPVYSSPWKFE